MRECKKCGSSMFDRRDTVGYVTTGGPRWICTNPMCTIHDHGGTIHKANDFRGSHGGRTHTTIVSNADGGRTRVSFDQKDGEYTDVHPQENKK